MDHAVYKLSLALQSGNSLLQDLDLINYDLQDSGVELPSADLMNSHCKLKILRWVFINWTSNIKTEAHMFIIQQSHIQCHLLSVYVCSARSKENLVAQISNKRVIWWYHANRFCGSHLLSVSNNCNYTCNNNVTPTDVSIFTDSIPKYSSCNYTCVLMSFHHVII